MASSKPEVDKKEYQPVYFTTTKTQYGDLKPFGLKIFNNTDQRLRFQLDCPKQPFSVYKTAYGQSQLISANPEINCETKETKAFYNFSIAPQKEFTLNYKLWSNQLFSENADYYISANLKIKDKNYQVRSNQFSYGPRSFFGKLWLNVFYKPVYNLFIWATSITPGINLGLGIILLTLIIRIALFGQNQKALAAQRKMSKLQPKLNKLREQYKNNQAKMAEETLKIWQSEKVNPFSGIVPILIQFPILIAIFYVVQEGINPDMQALVYNFLQNFQVSSINTQFLGMDLTQRNLIALPLVVGFLQFLQIHLAHAKQNKQDKKANQMQSTMVMVMPALIAVFAASLPAGVGIYWATSTLFGVFQQLIVNKKH